MDGDQIDRLVSLVFLLIWGGLGYGVVRWAATPVLPRDVEQWSMRHGVVLREAEVASVQRYLARSRAWRRTGLAVPAVATLLILFVSPSVQSLVRPDSPTVVWVPFVVGVLTSPLAWVLAYTVGVAAAELTWPRRQSGHRRAAVVSARRVPDYLPRWVRACLRSAPLVAAAAVAIVGLVPQRYEVPGAPYQRDLRGVTFMALLVVLVVGLVELALRIVVTRPQPADDLHAVAVDDALRATALQALGGAGLATLGVLLEQALARVAYVFEIGNISDDIYWIYVTNGLGIVRIALVVGGLAAWWFVTSSQRWRVRRPLRPADGVS